MWLSVPVFKKDECWMKPIRLKFPHFLLFLMDRKYNVINSNGKNVKVIMFTKYQWLYLIYNICLLFSVFSQGHILQGNAESIHSVLIYCWHLSTTNKKVIDTCRRLNSELWPKWMWTFNPKLYCFFPTRMFKYFSFKMFFYRF